jgi:Dynamin family
MAEAERDAIMAAIGRLEQLAGEADRAELAALADRLAHARLRVLVAGEAKRGKSTLINALLGRAVLPAGVTPLTAIATTVTAGAGEGIEVTFTDGRTERFPLSALEDFGTERGNPANCRHVASITVWLDSPLLARGLEIVDTPGTGSVHAHNTVVADEALATMDAAIFVVTADPPVSASERDLLGRVAGLSVALFVVLNKADYLDPASLAEAARFTAEVAGQATGQPQRIYPVSARTALASNGLTGGGDAGFAAFESDLLAYLGAGRTTDLDRSVARHVRRIAQRQLDEVALARRAALLPGEDAADRVAAFRAVLASGPAWLADAEDRVNGQTGRMLAALNSAAADAERRLGADVGAQLAAILDTELAGATAADVERTGRTRLRELVLAPVEAWRRDQAAGLETGLQALAEREAAELDARLAEVRAAAADLLGIELAVPAGDERLGPDRRFFYVLDEQVDTAELLAGAIRRRLPGDLGRRVIRQRLLDQVPDFAGTQIGRARADLQYRLSEASRKLLAQARHRYAASTGHLTAALDRAATIRATAAGQAEHELARLTEREDQLRAVTQVVSAEHDPGIAGTFSDALER